MVIQDLLAQSLRVLRTSSISKACMIIKPRIKTTWLCPLTWWFLSLRLHTTLEPSVRIQDWLAQYLKVLENWPSFGTCTTEFRSMIFEIEQNWNKLLEATCFDDTYTFFLLTSHFRYFEKNTEMNGTIPESIGNLIHLTELYVSPWINENDMKVTAVSPFNRWFHWHTVLDGSMKFQKWLDQFQKALEISSNSDICTTRAGAIVESGREMTEWYVNDLPLLWLNASSIWDEEAFSSHVRHLQNNPGITGTIPESIGSLTNLRELYGSQSLWFDASSIHPL